MKPLENKVAIITGASAPNGIGRATAMQLAKDGAKVIVTDISGWLDLKGSQVEKLDLLNLVVQDIREAGGDAVSVEVDVTKEVDIENCVQCALSEFGRLDILVNNAGTTIGTGNFLESRAEDWMTSFQVNLLGSMLFSQAVIPAFRQVGGGSIVNVGSTGSLGAEAGFGAYTAMKHGLIGLTKTVAAEFGCEGIRCNAVCPGYTNTDMHMAVNARLAAEQTASIEEIMGQRYESVAMRRAGAPEEVAKAISYLAGPLSSYVTGVALPVSGGVPFGI